MTPPVINEITFDAKGRVAALRRENRWLRSVAACHHALVRSKNEVELLSEMCRKVTDQTGCVLAFAAMAEPDDRKPMRWIAGAGCDESCLKRARTTWVDLERSGEAVRKALRTLRPVVCRMPEEALIARLGCGEAMKRRAASVLLLPLVRSGKPFGLWCIYAGKRHTFDGKAVNILEKLAADLAHVILAGRPARTRQREIAELALRYEALTPREREVMGLVSAGMANKRIAAQLGTAEITVKIQRGKVMNKMHARSVADLVRMADKLSSKTAGDPELRWHTKLGGRRR